MAISLCFSLSLYVYIYIVFYSFFIIVHCWFHYIIQQFSLKYVDFESTLLNFLRKPLRNLTFQRFVRVA